MGLFDFLGMDFNKARAPSFAGVFSGAPQEPEAQQLPAPNANPGALAEPPAQTYEPPGLLDRLRAPDDRGLSFGDKLFAAGAIARGDGDSAMNYIGGKRKEANAQKLLAQTQADRARKNAAFRAAYKDGKFDPGVYAANLGASDVDPSGVAALTKAFASKPHIEATAHGIYEVPEEGGSITPLKEFPEGALKGWREAPDGSGWEPVPGGPYDPAVIARNAGVRRDAIVKRPMPSRARAGTASTGLPPGYVPR